MLRHHGEGCHDGTSRDLGDSHLILLTSTACPRTANASRHKPSREQHLTSYVSQGQGVKTHRTATCPQAAPPQKVGNRAAIQEEGKPPFPYLAYSLTKAVTVICRLVWVLQLQLFSSSKCALQLKALPGPEDTGIS